MAKREFKKQAIVIVDGPNRAGKTTLVNGLKELFHFDVVFKGNAPATPELAEINTWNMLIEMASTGKSYLCDRLPYPTDLVYRPVLEGRPSTGLEIARPGMERLMRLMNIFFVFVIADPDELVERHAQMDEHWHIKDVDVVQRLGLAYIDFVNNFALPKSIVNTTIYNNSEIAIERAWRDIIYHFEVSTKSSPRTIIPGKVVQLR